MEINLPIHKVRSMTEKHGNTCAVYFLSLMLIKRKKLIFKQGYR